jgi:hypothetical protein
VRQRLDQLCFLPPPAGTPWSGPPEQSTRAEISRLDGQKVSIELPLFWYDPPWHVLSTATADAVAVATSRLGILVSAMRSDLAGPDQSPAFHATTDDAQDLHEDQPWQDSLPLPRIVPYRPERYGLSARDFDDARIIDLRLTMNRDETGRFAYSPEQIERWESTPASEPLAGGGWVPSASFPPDVESMQHLSSKLNQLRMLSPTAAALVSMEVYRLEDELPQVVAAAPDGVILRTDELNLSGLQLAAVTRRARQLMDHTGGREMPLWIVPGEVTPEDAAKLVTLGASAVAIDHWCGEILEEALKQDQNSSQYTSRGPNLAFLRELVDRELSVQVERFIGLFNSIGYLPRSQRLASLSEAWSKVLGIPVLPLPVTTDP